MRNIVVMRGAYFVFITGWMFFGAGCGSQPFPSKEHIVAVDAVDTNIDKPSDETREAVLPAYRKMALQDVELIENEVRDKVEKILIGFHLTDYKEFSRGLFMKRHEGHKEFVAFRTGVSEVVKRQLDQWSESWKKVYTSGVQNRATPESDTIAACLWYESTRLEHFPSALESGDKQSLKDVPMVISDMVQSVSNCGRQLRTNLFFDLTHSTALDNVAELDELYTSLAGADMFETMGNNQESRYLATAVLDRKKLFEKSAPWMLAQLILMALDNKQEESELDEFVSHMDELEDPQMLMYCTRVAPLFDGSEGGKDARLEKIKTFWKRIPEKTRNSLPPSRIGYLFHRWAGYVYSGSLNYEAARMHYLLAGTSAVALNDPLAGAEFLSKGAQMAEKTARNQLSPDWASVLSDHQAAWTANQDIIVPEWGWSLSDQLSTGLRYVTHLAKVGRITEAWRVLKNIDEKIAASKEPTHKMAYSGSIRFSIVTSFIALTFREGRTNDGKAMIDLMLGENSDEGRRLLPDWVHLTFGGWANAYFQQMGDIVSTLHKMGGHDAIAAVVKHTERFSTELHQKEGMKEPYFSVPVWTSAIQSAIERNSFVEALPWIKKIKKGRVGDTDIFEEHLGSIHLVEAMIHDLKGDNDKGNRFFGRAMTRLSKDVCDFIDSKSRLRNDEIFNVVEWTTGVYAKQGRCDRVQTMLNTALNTATCDGADSESSVAKAKRRGALLMNMSENRMQLCDIAKSRPATRLENM